MSARISYSVDVDEASVAKAVSAFEFVGGNTSQAIRIAINKTAPKIRTLASRKIRDQVELRASYVRERLKITKATTARLSAAISTPARGLLLSRYARDNVVSMGSDKFNWIKPPPTPPTGIVLRVKTAGEDKILRGEKGFMPFFIVLKNSRTLGIATRRDTPGKNGGLIDVFYGPSLSQVFRSVREDVLPDARAEYQTQLIDAMRYILIRQHPPEPLT